MPNTITVHLHAETPVTIDLGDDAEALGQMRDFLQGSPRRLVPLNEEFPPVEQATPNNWTTEPAPVVLQAFAQALAGDVGRVAERGRRNPA